MNVLGASVPVSYLTVVSLVGGAMLSLLIWRPLSGRLGWRPWYALLGLLAVTVTLSLTLPPGMEERHSGLRECLAASLPSLVDAARDVGSVPTLVNATGDVGTVSGSVLNALLLLPVGFAVAAASRRVWTGVIVSVALPIVIEAAQTMIPGRLCDPGDVWANVLGGLLGVLVAATLVRRPDRRTRR